VKNDKLGKTTDFFNEGLRRVFVACHRVLRDDGLLVFTFHHNKIWAWEGIAQLLLDAGFYISATPIVRSEGRGEVHSSEGNIRYDCVLVCRKRPSPSIEKSWSSLKERILEDAALWAKRTLQSGMPVNEVDVFTIVMGKTIGYYTKAFANGKYDDETITLAGILREMANLVDRVGEHAKIEQSELPDPCIQKVEQLTLFVVESKVKYG